MEVLEDLYGLDLAQDWRAGLEDRLLDDTDSEMLYRYELDGFEDDTEVAADLGLAPMSFAECFEPFNDSCTVPTPAELPVMLARRIDDRRIAVETVVCLQCRIYIFVACKGNQFNFNEEHGRLPAVSSLGPLFTIKR